MYSVHMNYNRNEQVQISFDSIAISAVSSPPNATRFKDVRVLLSGARTLKAPPLLPTQTILDHLEPGSSQFSQWEFHGIPVIILK